MKKKQNRKEIVKKCKICGKEFTMLNYRSRMDRGIYCSRECFFKSKGELITRHCNYCGKGFKIAPSRLKYGRGKYCSKKCGGKAKSEFSEYLGNNHPNWKGDEVNRICDYCSKSYRFIDGNSHLGKHTFCSRECYYEFMKGPNHPLWLDGKSFEPYGLDFNNELKLGIRNRDSYKCRECGCSEEQLGYKLSIHHINYDKTNNLETNLISLCKSCHMKTNFNRDDWIEYYKNKLDKGS